MQNLLKHLSCLKKQLKIAETSQKKQQLAEGRANRMVVMNDLLSKLSGSKREVMAELLEGVRTEDLRKAFKKYATAVTSGAGTTSLSTKSSTVKPLAESKKEITGNKTTNLTESVESDNSDSESAEIIEMKRLAGL